MACIKPIAYTYYHYVHTVANSAFEVPPSMWDELTFRWPPLIKTMMRRFLEALFLVSRYWYTSNLYCLFLFRWNWQQEDRNVFAFKICLQQEYVFTSPIFLFQSAALHMECFWTREQMTSQRAQLCLERAHPHLATTTGGCLKLLLIALAWIARAVMIKTIPIIIMSVAMFIIRLLYLVFLSGYSFSRLFHDHDDPMIRMIWYDYFGMIMIKVQLASVSFYFS